MFSQHNFFLKRQYRISLLYPFFLLFLLLFALLAPFCGTTRAYAATSPITITSQTASTDFAKDINFQVSVSDTNSPITQAMLTITMKEPRYSQQTYTVPVATPGQSLQLNYQDDISGNNFLFSGTPLTYAWMFHDQNDHWLTGDSQSYTVIDTRFQWQHLSQGALQVNWYGQGTDFGQIVLSQALDNVKRISTNLGGNPTSPITLWVYQSSDDFRGALPPNTFEWVGGLAYPPLDEAFVVVNSPNDDTLIRDMPHELTHVIFHELVPLTDLVPTWFDEGLAVYNQTYHEPEMTQRFNDALTTHHLLRFNTLTQGFPADSGTAYLAYAQSWNFISYMYNTFGVAKMAHLIQLMHRGSNAFEFQITSALGEDSTQIENQWLISLHQPAILAPTPAPQPSHSSTIPRTSLTDTTAPWLIGVGILLVLFSLSGVSGLFLYQRRKMQPAVSAAPATPVGPAVPSQPTPQAPASNNYTYVPATPHADTYEQYTQSSLPYFDATVRPVNYIEPSYYDAPLPRTSPSDRFAGQAGQISLPSETGKSNHTIATANEEFPPFNFGQEYVNGQTGVGQHTQQEQYGEHKGQPPAPQE